MTQDRGRATFAGGCFWCVEAAFDAIHGISTVTSGYCGGDVTDPTYEEVLSGGTGHAEAVQIEYDPNVVSFNELLDVFFSIHDPTSLNRQGPDVGSQYRSAIFYHDDHQRKAAEQYITNLAAEDTYEDEIVTEIEPMEQFYPAESYHQKYFEKNPNDAYCRMHARPKVKKVKTHFPSLTVD